MSEKQAERFPLEWPTGWPRTAAGSRQRAQFGYKTAERGKRPLTVAVALDRLERHLDLLGATDIVMSTNVRLRVSGMVHGDGRPENGDPGVAVYFFHKKRPLVLACDKWQTVADNIAAIAQHVDAIRRMDRYGVGKLEQALAGYTRLLSGRRAWFDVLQVKADSSWEVIESNYRRLAKDRHPDRGGSPGQMAELNEAFDTAKQERGKT